MFQTRLRIQAKDPDPHLDPQPCLGDGSNQDLQDLILIPFSPKYPQKFNKGFLIQAASTKNCCKGGGGINTVNELIFGFKVFLVYAFESGILTSPYLTLYNSPKKLFFI